MLCQNQPYSSIFEQSKNLLSGTLFQWSQMLAGPPALDLEMKLIDIVSDRTENADGQHALHTAVIASSEVHVFHRYRKTSFCLDAPVHPQQIAPGTGYPFQAFGPFFCHDL